MRVYREFDRLLRQEDFSQLMSVFLLFIVLGLVFSWTGNALTPNDSWYTVTALNRALLGLIAIYLGLRHHASPFREQAGAALVLCTASLVSVPFSLLTFAASYPAASLHLSIVFDLVFPLGLFGFCLLTARLLPKAPWLALITCPAIVALAVAVDELLRYRLFSPITILGSGNWPLVAVWALAAVAAMLHLLVRARGEP